MLVGVLGPLISTILTDQSFSLGPRFYKTLLWVPLLFWSVFLGFYQFSRIEFSKKKFQRFMIAFFLSIIFITILGSLAFPQEFLNLSYEMCFLFLGGSAIAFLICFVSGMQIYKCFLHYSSHSFSSAISHFGVGLFLLGLFFSSLLEREVYGNLTVGQSIELLNETYFFKEIDKIPYKSSLATRSHIIFHGTEKEQHLFPERHYYYAQKSFKPVSSLFYSCGSIYNLTLGDPQENQSWQIRLRKTPLLFLVWIGGFLVVFGCLIGICFFFRRSDKK
jgi:cytochrome c biogenesis factor